MSYKIVIAPAALEPLSLPANAKWLSPAVLETIAKELAEIEADPIGTSRKACFPFFPTGHVAHFRHVVSPSKFLSFAVFFLFGPGQEDITVTKITLTTIP